MGVRRRRGARTPSAALALAAVALAAVVFTFSAAVALDALAPGAGPLAQPLSSFVHTSYAWLWRLAAGSAAGAVLLLALALRGRAAAPSFGRVLAGAGVGLAVAALCPADLWFPWERPPTWRGFVHVAAVAVVVASFALVMVRRARRLPWSAGAAGCRACEVAYLLSLGGSLAYVAAAVALARPMLLFGLCERLLMGFALAWCGLLAAAVLRHTGEPIAAGPHR